MTAPTDQLDKLERAARKRQQAGDEWGEGALMQVSSDTVLALVQMARGEDGLREAAREVVSGTTALTPDHAMVRVPRSAWKALRDALCDEEGGEG